MAVGIDSGDVFDRITGDFSLELERGDCLVLYTDGVTEALDAKAMNSVWNGWSGRSRPARPRARQGVIARLTDDVHTFAGSHPQNDDITLIVVRKT